MTSLSLLDDPSLVDAQQEFERLQLAPLKQWTTQTEQLNELFHQVVNEIIGHAHDYAPLLAATDSAAASASSDSSSTTLTSTSLHQTIHSLKAWIRLVLHSLPHGGHHPDSVTEAQRIETTTYLRTQATKSLDASISDEIKSTLITSLTSRLPELISHSKRTAITQFSQYSLKDYDWNARVVLSSSLISNLRKPLLQLTLTLQTPDGNTKNVPLEMDEAGLDAVLEQMSKIAGVVDEYSTTTPL